MASPEAIQEYVQRHKVGVLFEDLMAKVISDMPDDPLIYLARILQLRAEKKEGRSLRKTTDFESVAVAKKNYDKPWTTNSKRMKPKEVDLRITKKGTRPEWDHKTKTVTSSFDDIWGENKATRKAGSPSKAVTVGGLAAWADAGMEDGEDVMFSSYGYRGPHRSHREVDNPLAGELGLSKEKSSRAKPAPLYSGSKKSGRNNNSARHKAELQQYIKEREQRSDSGIEDDRHHDSDDAIELMEDLDELRREGARNLKHSGVRISSSRRGQPTPTTPVRVSICARCAKVMGGGLSGGPAQSTPLDDLVEIDTERQTTNRLKSGPFGVVGSDDDDEEFESVSQVTGPRRPVWQESDNEAVTPKKGKHMLTSNMSPSKGLPMYSPDHPASSSRGKKGSTMPARSDQFYGHTSPDHDYNPMRMTWSPAMASGPEYSEKNAETARTVTVNTSRTAKDEDIMTGRSQGTGWQVPPDYDTDSSFYGSPGGKPMRQDRAY